MCSVGGGADHPTIMGSFGVNMGLLVVTNVEFVVLLCENEKNGNRTIGLRLGFTL